MKKQNSLSQRKDRTLRMVQLALLAAVEVILTLLPVQIGTISLNFGLVPIVIAGIFLSPTSGALIGAVSGFVTMTQVLSGQSVFYMFLITENPIAASILCVLKTTFAGLIAGLSYRLMRKLTKSIFGSAILPAVLCPLVNTGTFALAMFTIFGKALMEDPTISSWSTGGGLVALVFVVLIGVNFFVELGLNVLVCPVLAKSLDATKIFKKRS